MSARSPHFIYSRLENLSLFLLPEQIMLHHLSPTPASPEFWHTPSSFTFHLSILQSRFWVIHFSYDQCLVITALCWILLCARILTLLISNLYKNPAKTVLSGYSYEYQITYNKLSLLKGPQQQQPSLTVHSLTTKPWAKHIKYITSHCTNLQDIILSLQVMNVMLSLPWIMQPVT